MKALFSKFSTRPNFLFWFSVITIITLAAVLRFYKIGQLPAGMTWDEAAIGYNGYAVVTTRRDEWLHFLPISFQSFGDYKAPLAIYLNGIFTTLLGLQLWVVRLPFVLSGVMAVALMMMLTHLIFIQFESKKVAQSWSLAAGFLVALSPWHLHFSRVGFESGLATTQLLLGVTCFIFAWKKLDSQLKSWWQFWRVKSKTQFWPTTFWYLLGVSFFVTSMYTYHSAKIVAPLLGLSLAWIYRTQIKRNILLFMSGVLWSAILLLPMLYDTLFGPGAERLEQTSIFTRGMPPLQVVSVWIQNFGWHLSPQFLVMGATDNLRHSTGSWGVFLPSTFLIFILGLLSIFTVVWRNIKNRTPITLPKSPFTTWLRFAVLWIAIGILPASIGFEVPHPNRALLSFPGFLIFTLLISYLLLEFIKKTSLNSTIKGSHGEKNLVIKSLVGSWILLHSIFFIGYWQHYLSSYQVKAADPFKAGYLEAIQWAVEMEQTHPELEKIIISDLPGQPYIYTLFARGTSPIAYHGGSLVLYEFKDVTVGDYQRSKAIVVGTAADRDLPTHQADKLIYGPDGELLFQLFYRP